MKKIFEMYGGSKAYHLDTPSSDKDVRFVFLNTDKAKIIGLDRYEHQDIKSDTEDSFGWELRHLLCLCRKSNTQILELLYATEWVLKTPEWDLIAKNKEKLIDSEKLFKSLLGYIAGERKLFLGIRTGALGGKRKNALDKFGYSPSNAVQLLRLTFCGQIFFKHGYFPVDISKFPFIYSKLMDIKLNPERHNKQDILEETLKEEEKLKDCFNNRDSNYDYKFNFDLANDICCQLYKPLL